MAEITPHFVDDVRRILREMVSGAFPGVEIIRAQVETVGVTSVEPKLQTWTRASGEEARSEWWEVALVVAEDVQPWPFDDPERHFLIPITGHVRGRPAYDDELWLGMRNGRLDSLTVPGPIDTELPALPAPETLVPEIVGTEHFPFSYTAAEYADLFIRCYDVDGEPEPGYQWASDDLGHCASVATPDFAFDALVHILGPRANQLPSDDGRNRDPGTAVVAGRPCTYVCPTPRGLEQRGSGPVL